MKIGEIGLFMFFICCSNLFSQTKNQEYVLLSNNGGKGIDYGIKYEYPDGNPTNPSDILRDDATKFGNRLLNGDIYNNWWDVVGWNWRDYSVVFYWPEKHQVSKIRVKMSRPQRPKEIEIYGKVGDEEEWYFLGKIDVKKQEGEWSEFQFSEPKILKKIKLLFKLENWGYYINEVEFWGIPGTTPISEIRPVVEGKKLYVVKNKKPTAFILIPEENSKYFNKAKESAELLQGYIFQMTGATLPIIKEPVNIEGTFISTGDTKISQSYITDFKEGNYPVKERFIVKRIKDYIFIKGNDAGNYQGTKRAVYLFLEKFGFGWFAPDNRWKVIPKKEELYVEELNIDYTPAFSHRAIWSPWKGFDEVTIGLGGVKGHYSHILYSLIPPEQYFKDHPEYFSLVNGERISKDGQLCFSNPDVVNIISEKIKEHFRKNPDDVMHSLSPNDCGGFCECENCKKLGKTPSEQMLAFANIIGERIKKEFPDKKIIFYAYWFTKSAPENMQAQDNIVVMVIDDTCKAHSLLDKNCPSKKEWTENFLNWKKTGAKLAIYQWYIPGCNDKNWRDAPFIPGEAALEDLRFWKQQGVEWVFFESYNGEKAENYPLRWPLYYIAARGMENPDIKAENIIHDACDKLFGSAGKEMAEFYLELSNALKNCKDHSYNWTPPSVYKVYTPEEMVKLRKILHKAMEKTIDADDEVRWRMNEVMKCWINFEQEIIGEKGWK